MGQSKGKTGRGVTLAPAPDSLGKTRDTGAARLDQVGEGAGFREFRRGGDGATVLIYRNRDGRGGDTVTRAVTEWLDWLKHRGHISSDMWDAGDKLRELHSIAFGSGYATVNMDGTGGATGPSTGSNRLGDTRHRYMTIRAAMLDHDPKGWAVAEDVSCNGLSAKEAARRCGARGRDGTEMLRLALDALSHLFRKGKMPVKAKPAHEGPDQGVTRGETLGHTGSAAINPRRA
jgi:hypothetical protein